MAILAVFSMLVISAACAPASSPAPPTPPVSSQVPTTPPPAPESLPPSPTVEWSADGVIGTGEYAGVKTFDDYEIRWISDEQHIYIAMKAKTSGWVAVGIQPGSMMKDADMMFGFVKDGKTMVSDTFSTGSYGPHPPDTDLGGKNNILEFGGREEGGYTIIEFKRALTTGDKYDHPLSKGVNKIIWAYGSDDELTPKHIVRGYGEIDL
jgi:hypothetical protein